MKVKQNKEVALLQVRFEDVHMAFDDHTVLDNINFEIPENELVTILGPSGCGKSTTLMLISGLIFPNSGKIFFGDKEVTKLDAVDRKVGMVFQNYALYPHLTASENIQFPLKMQKVPKKEREERALELAKLVKIENLVDKKPAELSGGQQQRVAIARALSKRPSLLLMDEPLSNLDARLRIEMREEIRRIQQETKITTIFVTHDQEEALSISDNIMVLNKGYIQQYSTPRDLYNTPKNLFVAKFLGNPIINTLEIDETLDLNPFHLTDQNKKMAKTMAIRPESFYEVESEEAALISGTVRFVEVIGKNVTVHVNTDLGEIVATELDFVHEEEDTIHLAVKNEDLLLFDEKEQIINRGVSL